MKRQIKVYALPASEDWICDQLVDDFNFMCRDIAVYKPGIADIIWLLSDWRWRSLGPQVLSAKKVVTTVHHIVPEKFDRTARMDFEARDAITNLYHVYNQRTYDFIRPLTKKPIKLIPYWANGIRWKKSSDKNTLRTKYNLPTDGFLVGSFQRDTEGYDLKTPKLEKGPDLLADFLIERNKEVDKFHVVLAGWRRQYIISRLEKEGVKYSYFERPSQPTINELYQTLDLYPITARCEGGPQALIECGLLGVPVVSRPVGIAEQVLPEDAINEDVYMASPIVPNVANMILPRGIEPYRQMFEELMHV
jgi:glycosyltransferase involved in cell wall biosynthesis